MAPGGASVNAAAAGRERTFMFESLKTRVAGHFRRRPVDVAAHKLYVAVVEAARTPVLFTTGGVADSLDGRFDMIALHLVLLMERLARAEADDEATVRALEMRLMEVHFSDMDQSLRERGVGDLGVGKRVKAMARAFMGRRKAYQAAFETLDGTADRTPLEEALVRNVYRGTPPGPDVVAWLADYCVDQRRALGSQSFDALMSGEAAFSDARS